MEFRGEAFLLNFSLLAITFSAVSALVMLLRQTMGGKLSNFDIFLVNAYVAHGFVLAIAAILPVLIAQFDLGETTVWVVASLLSGTAMGAKTANTIRQRHKIATGVMPFGMIVSFTTQWIGVSLFFLNAIVPAMRSLPMFSVALTICLATIMWAFVRRVSSLLGEKPQEDWDPTKG